MLYFGHTHREVPMPEFPSEEWLAEYVERINASPAYEAAATCEGDVAYVIEAEPGKDSRRTCGRGSISGTANAAAGRWFPPRKGRRPGS
jgi:hypothetical protein